MNRIKEATTKLREVEAYRKAADQGDSDAQNNLGNMYYNGEGVPKDAVQAGSWYRKAAGQGHPLAQYKLGLMYSTGTGVPKDVEQAVSWFSKAADQGHPGAQIVKNVIPN